LELGQGQRWGEGLRWEQGNAMVKGLRWIVSRERQKELVTLMNIEGSKIV
jgi:hypothetical protein